MRDGDYKTISRERLLEKLENYGTIEETRRRAFFYADQAGKNLEVLPKTEYRLALEEIPRYMIERNK
jgi:geranylgeranyl pyrophosphate synthase